jgi:hypothetical protein
MAHTILLPGANPVLQKRPKLTLRRGPYTYTVETHGDNSIYSVSDGTRSVSFPIYWSFGVEVQAWLLEKDGKYYESVVSYYPETDSLNVTVGDEGLVFHSLEEAAGRLITEPVLKDCFGCHASNAVVDHKLNLTAAKPGVTCERCHDGAMPHMVAQVEGQVYSTPPNLHQLSTEGVSTFCGQCHRTWETVVRNGWRGAANVRFAPYRLANSKCFDGADSRISCVACHNPHESPRRDASFYDGKCLACHTPHSAATAPPMVVAAGKSCPVATADCVKCHMPKIGLPDEHVTFTDHWIRVVHPGERYPD